MNILEKIKSVNILRPRDGDIIVVRASDKSETCDLIQIKEVLERDIDEMYPNNNIRLVIANNIEEIKVIRKED